MFNAGSNRNRTRRLLRAVAPVQPPRVSPAEQRRRPASWLASSLLHSLSPSRFLLLGAALVVLAVSSVIDSPPAAAQDPTPTPLSTNANLSSLTASYANGNSETFTAMALTPVFDSGTTTYQPDLGRPRWARDVPVYVTHVKVTPTVADTGKATVQVGKTTLAPVTSGEASEAIPLAVPYTNIIVRVTAEDGKTTRDYRVPVSRNGSFTSIFGVLAGDGALHLSWNPPAFDRDEVIGYDVHYTSSATVAGDAEVGSDVAKEWVDAGHSGGVLQTNHSITGLTNDTAYRVRVRSVSNAGDGSSNVGGVWASGSGTPQIAASDATLSAMSAGSSESSDGPYTALTLSPAFDSSTTGYTASVANPRTHVKLDLQMTQRNAAVGVAKSPEGVTGFSHTAGLPSSWTIPLDVGANVIIVRVRASDFKTYKNYTVTVTRLAGGL